MGLYERLGGTELPKISVHAFMSAMQENVLGNMSNAQVTSNFALTAGEQTEALTLKAKVTEPASAADKYIRGFEYENILIAWEGKLAPYTTVAAVKTRLGV